MSFDNAILDPLLRDANANSAASQTTTEHDVIMGGQAGQGGMSVDLGVGCLDRTPVQKLLRDWDVVLWGK